MLLTISMNGLADILNTPVVKFGLLFAILLVIGHFIIFHPSMKQRKDAINILNSYSPHVFSIVMMNVDLIKNSSSLSSYEDFKNRILEDSCKDAWSFIQEMINKDIEENKIDPFIGRLINITSIKSLINMVINRQDVDMKLRVIYNRVVENSIKKEEEANEIVKLAEEIDAIPDKLDKPITINVFGEDVEVKPEDLYQTDKKEDEMVELFGDTEVETNPSEIEEIIHDAPPIDDDNDPNTVG